MSGRLPHTVARVTTASPEVASGVADERYFTASPGRRRWWRWRRNRVAVTAGLLLLFGVFWVLAADVVAPYGPEVPHPDFVYAPPQAVHFFRDGRLVRPFVIGPRLLRSGSHGKDMRTEDGGEARPIRFFCTGTAYSVLGLVRARWRLICPPEGGTLFLLGTDSLGRDMASRLVHGGRVSLAAGLAALAVSLMMGFGLGRLARSGSGFLSLTARSLAGFVHLAPGLAVLAVVAAALPMDWNPASVFAAVTGLIGTMHWLRPMAARGSGLAHLAGTGCLVLPSIIATETALSFFGVGLRPPLDSWGVVLAEARSLETVSLYPWLVLPALVVVLAMLMLRLLGDGLRDGAREKSHPVKTP